MTETTIAHAPTASSAPEPLAAALPWAVFLGTSWTWCIGMFLPVLLVRDYGPWGWVAFAVPNVIGAAAMGWVLRRQGQSERLAGAHRAACAGFSVVTLAFHVQFGMLLLFLTTGGWIIGMAVGFLVILLLGEWRRRADLWTAAAVWGVSLVMLVGVWLAHDDVRPQPVGVASRELAMLAPVMAFGFLLCPYLDLTFHRARQALAPAGARAAFTVGFGVVFLLMIVGTLVYAPSVATAVTWYPSGGAFLGPVLTTCVAVHMGAQVAFTTAAHIRELRSVWQWAVLPALLAAAVVLPLAPVFDGRERYGLFEGSYRAFMGFYGLVFPAYVWVCMTPTWRDPAPPTRRALLAFALAVLIAAPMFWAGFIERRMIWLVPGLVVVLLARLAVPARRTAPAPV